MTFSSLSKTKVCFQPSAKQHKQKRKIRNIRNIRSHRAGGICRRDSEGVSCRDKTDLASGEIGECRFVTTLSPEGKKERKERCVDAAKVAEGWG